MRPKKKLGVIKPRGEKRDKKHGRFEQHERRFEKQGNATSRPTKKGKNKAASLTVKNARAKSTLRRTVHNRGWSS